LTRPLQVETVGGCDALSRRRAAMRIDLAERGLCFDRRLV